MKLSLGFSTCPNDTFIFDAMVHGKVDTEGLSFDICMADIEDLNQSAANSATDITKISFFAFAYVASEYQLLNTGSALGNGNGPLLIAKKDYLSDEISDLRIAIPGRLTTANLLFSIFYPEAVRKTEYLFSAIVDAISSGKVEAGIIIHESRFTYQKKGFVKIADLGEKWEETTGYPIPLGGIAVKKYLDKELRQKIERVVRRSVEFALFNRMSSRDFVRLNARELDDYVIDQHINLYVNDYTVDLGSTGRTAIETLLNSAFRSGIIPDVPDGIFL